LDIVLWIPITIEYNDSICRGQVNSHSAGTGGEQEHKAIWILVVPRWIGSYRIGEKYEDKDIDDQPVDGLLPVVAGYSSIQSLTGIFPHLAEFVNDVDHFDHLRKE
jgi:hypothetical protein